MSDENQSANSSGVDLFHIAFLALKLLSTVAICSIAGYMIVGGIVEMIGLALNADGLAKYSRSVGWLLGAIVGLANDIPRMSKSSTTTQAKKSGTSTSRPGFGPKLKWPTLMDFGKSLAVCSLFGILTGIISSLFLSLLLISVTTSPFAPNSWRPGSRPLVHSDEIPIHERYKKQRDAVGTSFTHPLLGPIFLTATGSCLAIGFLAGVATAFFPNNEDSITLHKETTPR